MSKSAYFAVHDNVAGQWSDPQERNREWWERLPMTYADWDESNRVPATDEDFRRINEAYLGSNPWLRQHFNFGALKGKRVLEIGCGAGAAACLMARGGAGVTAIDITHQAVSIARRNLRAQGLDGVVIERMDAEQMTFAEGSFDFIYSWGVIHHSSNPEKIFREIERVLAPGGTGLVMVYNRASLRYWAKGLYWLVMKGKLFEGESLSTVQRFFTDGFFHRHYSASELFTLPRTLGLAVFSIAKTHMAKRMVPGIPRLFDDALKKRVGWLLVAQFSKPVNALVSS
jgi:2-polyprenyl-3-methyl-5-hydroxy-6-metoxy-1,4-benzoquinol methylase